MFKQPSPPEPPLFVVQPNSKPHNVRNTPFIWEGFEDDGKEEEDDETDAD